MSSRKKNKKTPLYKRLIASAIITLAVIGSGSFGYEAYNYEFKPSEYSLFTVMHYKNGRKGGCTFAKLSDTLLITARHCTSELSPLNGITIKGVYYKAETIESHKQAYYNFGFFANGYDGYTLVRTATEVKDGKIARIGTELTDKLYYYGGRSKQRIEITEYLTDKAVRGKDGDRLMITLTLGQRGDSGTSVFNEYGEIVGHLIWGSRTGLGQTASFTYFILHPGVK